MKEYIKEDIDVFGVAKGFFGDRIKLFYNTEQSVSSVVIKEEKYGNFAELKGIDWKHWWEIPNKPNGEEYRQLNTVEGTTDKHHIDLNVEMERARNLFGN